MRCLNSPVLATAMLLASSSVGAEITLENDYVRWTIGNDGTQRSFLIKESGTELAAAGRPFPVAMLHDARGWHRAVSVVESEDTWAVEFSDAAGQIQLHVTAEKDHFFLELVGGVPQRADRVVFAQTSLNVPRETVGSYWPLGQVENLHVAFAALSPFVRNSYNFSRGTVFQSEALQQTGFDNIRLAILTTPTDRTLSAIEALELKYALLHLTLGGQWFRTSNELRKPYLFTNLTEANVEEVIRFAERGGFGYVLTFSSTWATSNGHYEPNPKSYPSGLAGLKAVADKLHAAGLKLGVHTLSACISRHDPHVAPVPDSRLAVANSFKLAKDVDATATEIPVDVSPAGMTKVDSYATAGCDLWIDDEIISYGDYTTSCPFRFAECRRGRYRTRPAAHKAGAEVRYLHRMYNYYLPDPATDLLPEIATRIATICNQCGVDMIYFDGGEAINRLGRHWHDSHWIQREVAKRLKREVLITGSGGNGGFGWHTHMRGVSNDGVNVATKRYLDDHKVPQRIAIYHRNLAAAEMGWLNLRSYDRAYPATQPDEWEYFCVKSLAYDSPVSLHMNTSYFGQNGRAGECLDIIRRYEDARAKCSFPAEAIEALKEPGKEFELLGDAKTGWVLRPIQYGPAHLVRSDIPGDATWTVNNPFDSQPLSVRLRARPALQPFGHEQNEVLFDPAESVNWHVDGVKGARLTVGLSRELPHDGSPSLRLTGKTTGAARGGRAWARKEFPARPNLDQCRSIGLWVHGDGSGVVLDVQLVDPSLIRARDYLVRVDFNGWRYVRIVDAASEEAFDYELWRHKGNLTSFAFNSIRDLRLQLVAMPVGKEVTVHVGRIEALREIPDRLVNPVIEVNAASVRLPVTVEPDEIVELQPDGICTVYDRDNNGKQTIRLAETLPIIKAGKNAFCISASERMPYVYLTPILRGDKLIRSKSEGAL